MLEGIRTQLDALAPDIASALLQPASESQISSLKASLGPSFEMGLLDLYRASAGLDPAVVANFAYGFSFMTVDEVISEVRVGDQAVDVPARLADEGIRPVMTIGKSRVAIGADASHCRLCVDFIPGEGGVPGQVIFLDEEMGVAFLLAPSVPAFLRQFETDLAEGRYTLQEDALEDGVQWLSVASEIDVQNWHDSATWSYAHESRS